MGKLHLVKHKYGLFTHWKDENYDDKHMLPDSRLHHSGTKFKKLPCGQLADKATRRHWGYLESSARSTQLEGKWIQSLLQIFWIILSLTTALPGWNGLSSTALTGIICLHREHHHHLLWLLVFSIAYQNQLYVCYVHFSRGCRDFPNTQQMGQKSSFAEKGEWTSL